MLRPSATETWDGFATTMFFYFGKVFWFVLQPSSLLFLAVAAALFALRIRRLELAQRLAWVALGLGLCALSPLPNLLLLPLEQRFSRVSTSGPPITGIIVLGGGESAEIARERGTHAMNEAGERISEAVAFAVAFPTAQIVFSGGTAWIVPSGILRAPAREAAAVRSMWTSMGIADQRILIEDRSRDTWENAIFTKALLSPKPGQRWLLVTSAWHMPRAIGVFRAAGMCVEPWPVDYRTSGWSDGLQFSRSAAEGLERLDLVVREYAGLFTYWVGGRSASLFPGPIEATQRCLLASLKAS